jgi:predicted O-linked N-acetylglucosamine transferase (SPINDLY family)
MRIAHRRVRAQCCFNQSYRIESRLFAIWMRVLRAVPDSAL